MSDNTHNLSTQIAPPLSEDSFGVDLCDIDNDGEKEILAYLNNPYWCGNTGCHFGLFKQLNNDLYEYKNYHGISLAIGKWKR